MDFITLSLVDNVADKKCPPETAAGSVEGMIYF
jgi:hypothetical protein